MAKRDIIAAKLANSPRRGLSRVEAAIYVGVGTTKFDEMVADGRMPKPKRIDGRKVWDIRALDLAFDDLPSEQDAPNSWDDVYNEPAPKAGDVDQPRSHRGHLRMPITMPDDPETEAMIDQLVRDGLTRRFEPGEWEAEVCSRPLNKRERFALGEFYRLRNEPPQYVKGAGLDTAARLKARGYIVAIEEREGRAPFYRITPEGEAAWLTLDRAQK